MGDYTRFLGERPLQKLQGPIYQEEGLQGAALQQPQQAIAEQQQQQLAAQQNHHMIDTMDKEWLTTCPTSIAQSHFHNACR